MALTLHGTVSDNTVALDRPKVQPIIINGDMQVAQRGDLTGITSQTLVTTDRYQINIINLGTWSFTQSTDTPTGLGFSKSLKIDCTTADASPAAADNFYLSMQSEGRNIQGFEKGTSDAKTSTLAYWIKCNKTGNYVVELWDRTNDRHVAVLKTISAADTWQKVVCNFPADTTGAIASDNARSIMISWAFDSGTDFTSGTLPSTWASRSDANRFVGTNLGLGDNTANEVLITGVQWEVGTFDVNSIPAFQFEDVGTSLMRCYRYFYKDVANAPYSVFGAGFQGGSTIGHTVINFPTTMRALPTMASGGDFQLIIGSSKSVTSLAFDGNSRSLNNCRADCTVGGGGLTPTGGGTILRSHNNTASFISAEAEL